LELPLTVWIENRSAARCSHACRPMLPCQVLWHVIRSFYM